MIHKRKIRNLRRNKSGVSPAISSVILTASIVVLIMVALLFANDLLGRKIAENEFNLVKQTIVSTGLLMDDVAWTIGRVQTIHYSAQNAQVDFRYLILSYRFEVNGSTGWQEIFTSQTGILLSNMPTRVFTLGNNYFEHVSPDSNGSFLLAGSTTPVAEVFVIQKAAMADGDFIRTVVTPTIRMINSTILGTTQTDYYKFFVPSLIDGGQPRYSQSITLVGNNVTRYTTSGVSQVRITVTFPNASSGFDTGFFRFPKTSITVNLPKTSLVEFYVGQVKVILGAH